MYEEDDEAERLWRDLVGIPPERVKRMGAADNFWASGPTGPCGPCSELYYDFHPERGTAGADLDDDSRFIEFYNLVFMESNRAPDGTLTPLVRALQHHKIVSVRFWTKCRQPDVRAVLLQLASVIS